MFRKFAGTLVALALFAAPAFAETLKADKEKSKIDFVGKKIDKSKHEGGFKEFKAEADVKEGAPEKSSLLIEIDTDSLWSDSDNLTKHLKNPDFFDVKKHPKIKFESTKVDVDVEKGKGTIIGKLTMLDKEVEVKVPVTVEHSEKEIKVVADFKIDRTKWGMNYGKGMISDEVDIKAELLFPH